MEPSLISRYEIQERQPRVYFLRILTALLVYSVAQSALADVAVLANRSLSSITLFTQEAGQLSRPLTIPSGDSLPVFFDGSLQVKFGEGLQRQLFMVGASKAYYFTRPEADGMLQFEQIGLGEPTEPTTPPTAGGTPGNPSPPVGERPPVTIDVKLVVDDNEPTHRHIWEPKLRERVEDASEILERQTGIRLRVVEVTSWDSDDELSNFQQTLREFEKEVEPGKAQLVIGFSSQYQATRGRSHMGVTRWPMHSHILLKERSRNLLDVERLELLVHELGHYFGASHSPEPQSVMRPVLTRGPQRRVGSRIQFDPVNALIIALVGEDMRRNGVRDVRKLSMPTIERLTQIYGVLRLAMPDDPAAGQYLTILKLVSTAQQSPQQLVQQDETEPVQPLVKDTAQILATLVSASAIEFEKSDKLSGDELTNYLVRKAALAAVRLRSTNRVRAFLLALGIFMDDTDTLRSLPVLGDFVESVEPEDQREQRLASMGEPTMHDRRDLAKHFFLSAHLVVAGGKEPTATAGLAKEMRDADGGTGFSFVDMAANHAGIAFAERVLDQQIPLHKIAAEFHVDDYLPSLVGLKEGLTLVDLKMMYGGPNQPTVAGEIQAIDQRILDLPVYEQTQ